MELLAILLFGTILLGLEIYLHVQRVRRYSEIVRDLARSFGPTIATLSPDNRYILSLPESLSDSEFESAVVAMRESLDLRNSNIHIVIVHGNVTMVEFA